MAREARVNKPRGRVGQKAQPPERALALQTGRNVIRQSHHFEGGTEDELPRMKNERFRSVDFDQPGQIRLVERWIDVLIFVVIEKAKKTV